MSRQKELDADLKAIQQIELVAQLKNSDDPIVANESMYVLTTLAKINETRLKFCQESVAVTKKMANYKEARVKVTNTQLNKLKSAAKNKTGTTSKITKKNFQYE